MEERNTLLIVDDFEFNRLMLSDTFSDRRVVEAENGKRAIEEFEKNKDKLCAVLLDIMMPVMDGFGVLEYLVDNKYIDVYRFSSSARTPPTNRCPGRMTSARRTSLRSLSIYGSSADVSTTSSSFTISAGISVCW